MGSWTVVSNLKLEGGLGTDSSFHIVGVLKEVSY